MNFNTTVPVKFYAYTCYIVSDYIVSATVSDYTLQNLQVTHKGEMCTYFFFQNLPSSFSITMLATEMLLSSLVD